MNQPAISPTLQDQADTLPDRSAYKPGKIDPIQLQVLINNNPNLSQAQIAKLLGVSHQAVNQLVKTWGIDAQADKVYKSTRSDIFASMQRKILAVHLAESRIKKMPGNVAALWFNSLFNNERLERGQSTENVDQHTLIDGLSKVADTNKALEEKLAKLEEEV